MFDHFYISLAVSTELNDVDLKSWLLTVSNELPENILSSVELNSKQLTFYRRDIGTLIYYIAVLSRNLSNKEATKIAEEFSKIYEHDDFEINWSQTLKTPTKLTIVDDTALKDIILTTAKINHNKTVQDKIDNGWRYGLKLDAVNKTSPVCQDWDRLPDSYKILEIQKITNLLNTLKNMNLGFIKL